MFKIMRLAVVSVVGVTLVICLGGEADAVQNKGPVAPAPAAVLNMADNLGNVALAQAIANANLNEDIMKQFKPRTKGGLGVGAAPPAPPIKDSIELLIIDLARDKKGFAAAAMKQLGPDLAKVAQQTQAIAEINAFYAPKVKMGAQDPAVWQKLNDDMKAGAADLAKAAAANNPVAVQKAALKLNTSCVKCHEIFRVD